LEELKKKTGSAGSRMACAIISRAEDGKMK
jgi:hypothetical protein